MMNLKTLIAGPALLALTACGTPGPSVPLLAGSSIDVARDAIEGCSVGAAKAGQRSVNVAYGVNMIAFGILPGAMGTAAAEPAIRGSGEARHVDVCLEGQGYQRRNLNDAEIAAIDRADIRTRRALLNHFVNGGTLETFPGT